MLGAVLLLPLAWLLGSFPSAQLVARTKGVDVTAAGSGNPGASNVARLLGWRYGAAVLVIDFAKGALASVAGLWVADRPGAYLCGAAAVLGHTFPLWRKGGKGVATTAGMLIVLFPLVVIALAPVWILIARVLKKASLASLVVTVAFPALVAVFGYDRWEIGVLVLLALLVLARHSANIRRLLRREEIDLRSQP